MKQMTHWLAMMSLLGLLAWGGNSGSLQIGNDPLYGNQNPQMYQANIFGFGVGEASEALAFEKVQRGILNAIPEQWREEGQVLTRTNQESEPRRAAPELPSQSDYLLQWPVEPEMGVSAYFTDTAYYAVFQSDHEAIDIPAEQGSSVQAAHDGEVMATQLDRGTYYLLIGDREERIYTVYAHVETGSVKVGDRVRRGDIIGTVGGEPGTPGAGRSTGSHLHLEFYRGSKRVDPLSYLSAEYMNAVMLQYQTSKEDERLEGGQEDNDLLL